MSIEIIERDGDRGVVLEDEFVPLDVIFWNINRVLSYNALLNFITGPRGAGKTYGAASYVVKHFKKTKKQFIYVRRYKSEFDDAAKFFDAIAPDFPDDELTVKGKKFYINGELAGQGIVLSTSRMKKSTAYPEVDTIIFDEFIIDKGVIHYLKNETEVFLDLYETIARHRDVKCFFLSNAITVANPYFIYFDIKMPKGKDIIVKNDILYQYYTNPYLEKLKESTRMGAIIKDTDYGRYAIKNEFVKDSPKFIEKKTGMCQFEFSFIYKDKIYGVWSNLKAGKIFVSEDYDKSRKIFYAMTKEDHTPNTLLLSTLKQSPPFRWFSKQFQLGNVYFENQAIKAACFEIVKISNLY